MTEVVNTEQYEAWNGDSGERWAGDADGRDAVLQPVADVLFETADLAASELVIDIGCGCGATTLTAAELVGATGHAHGFDLSAPMLTRARQRAADRNLSNVDFDQADVEVADLSSRDADAVISRFGTMFFADPVAAFVNVASGVARGGRMILATWQPLIANEWLLVPGAAMLEFGSMPEGADPDQPGMFAQSEPDRVTGVLTSAGWVDVALDPVTVSLPLGATPADAAAYLAASGPGRAMLETIPTEVVPTAMASVESTLAEHVAADGVRLDGSIWIISATRPRSK